MTVKVMVLGVGAVNAGGDDGDFCCGTESARAGCDAGAGDNGLARSRPAANRIAKPERTPQTAPATIGNTSRRRCFLGAGFKGLVRSSAFINCIC